MTATTHSIHASGDPLVVRVVEYDYSIVVEIRVGDAAVDIFRLAATTEGARSAADLADDAMVALRDAARVYARTTGTAA